MNRRAPTGLPRLLLLMLFLWPGLRASAQTDVRRSSASSFDWDAFAERLSQLDDTEDADWNDLLEELGDAADQKLDINRCSRQDLERLPFLSVQQVMDIMEYRDQVGRLETPMELRLIPSLEPNDIDLLQRLIVFGPPAPADTVPSLRTVLKYGRHELMASLHVPLYDREGDRDGYLGPKYRHWWRYNFSYGQRVKLGVVAAQDAGEPFFAGKNGAGYDFYSAYFLVRDMRRLKALAIGRYRLRFGMGLILNNSYNLGKLVALSSLGRSSNSVSAYTSRTEANYLQGAAATVNLMRGLDMTAFASWRKIDTTPGSDSSSIATILKTGYHRTESEMARRRNASQTLLGGNLNYFRNGFHVGLTGLWSRLSRELRPDTKQAYRRWYPAGQRFWNLSVDYGYASARLNFSGETATGRGGHVATINALSYQFSSEFSLMALQRYYPYQFYPMFGRTYADGGKVNNESGIMIGGTWSPWRNAVVNFYSDFSYFAWPRYGVDASSHSYDEFVQLSFSRGRWDFLGRYRLRIREHNNAGKTELLWRREHRLRLSATYNAAMLSARTQVDFAATASDSTSTGFMVSENLYFERGPLKANASFGYFNTDDYQARVYAYERGPLYQFSFPSFFGEGIRYALTVQCDLLDGRLLLLAKVGVTDYFDRDHISSGLQRIDRSSQPDLDFQVRWKF